MPARKPAKRKRCSCGKSIFDSETDALAAAHARPTWFGLNPHVYRCTVRGPARWHIASKPVNSSTLAPHPGRTLAYRLMNRGRVDLAAFRAEYRLEPDTKMSKRFGALLGALTRVGAITRDGDIVRALPGAEPHLRRVIEAGATIFAQENRPART